MERSAAERIVLDADATDLEAWAARLVELDELLPEIVEIAGTAAHRLFEDAKATWIYGYFAATVVVSAAFCVQQLGAWLRDLEHLEGLPDASDSLTELVELALQRQLLDDEGHARLINLTDSARRYSEVGVTAYDAGLDQHDAQAEEFLGEPSLLTDAREALACSIAMARVLS